MARETADADFTILDNEVADGVVLDFAADGSLSGIDVQHASLKADIQSLSLLHSPVRELLAA